MTNKEDEMAGEIKSKSLLEIIKESFEKVKDSLFASQNFESLVDKLKILRSQAPTDEIGTNGKASWLKRLALVFAESNIFKQVFEEVNTQIPQIWSQLTASQKIKVGAIAPLVGAGAYLGGIGIAGAGSAVGVPVIIVTLLLLMINNSLIDFLDFAIQQLSASVQKEPSQDVIAKVFEEALSQGIIATFGKAFGPESGQRVDGLKRGAESPDAREFEIIAVSFLAEKYNGVGYVTANSSDGGIDGFIISEANKEVVLVQAKHYRNKVGFPEATQYLGTFFYWKKQFESTYPYPISKMILACSTDFTIEAKKVAQTFPNVLILEKVL